MTAVYWGIEYFVSFIESLMCFVFCGAFLAKEKNFQYKIPVMLSMALALLVILIGQIELFSAINTIITFVVAFITILLYFHSKFLGTIVIFISYYAVLFTADLITTSLTASIADSTINELFSEFSPGRILAALTSKSILSIICITFYRIKSKRTSKNTVSNIIFSLISILLLLISVSVYFGYSKNDNEQTKLTLAIFFIVILLLIVVIFIGITYFIDSKQKQQDYELAQKQTQMLEHYLKEQDNTFALWRKSIHDYKNTVLAMESMLKNGESDKLTEFLEKEHTAFMHRAEYIHTGNSIVDTVINTKYVVAKEKGIDYIVNAVMPEKCSMNDIHLAAILGNLIDNAIEASEKEEEPFIEIEIATKQSFLIIKITNKCTSPSVTGATTKDDKVFHGIGLKSVKQIIDQYDGNFDLTFEDGLAVAKIMIQN